MLENHIFKIILGIRVLLIFKVYHLSLITYHSSLLTYHSSLLTPLHLLFQRRQHSIHGIKGLVEDAVEPAAAAFGVEDIVKGTANHGDGD